MRFPILPLILTAAAALSGCSHSVEITYDRIPNGPTYIPFTLLAAWETYGVSGPGDTRIFDRRTRIPAGYPYNDYCYTGFGGVLLSCGYNFELFAFDRACPVERDYNVCVYVDYDINMAKCPKCGSTYYIFEPQAADPASGPALASGYGLRKYKVLFGVDNRYALISN